MVIEISRIGQMQNMFLEMSYTLSSGDTVGIFKAPPTGQLR